MLYTFPYSILALGVIGIIVATVATAVAMEQRRDARAAAFFAGALKNISATEDVTVRDGTYHVTDGAITQDGKSVETGTTRILALAYAKTLARRSPLFALDHADPDMLVRAAEALQRDAESLADVQDSPHHASLVRTGVLYPANFLRALADAEEARRAFLAEGTLDAYNRYSAALEDAAETYAHDIRLFEKTFRKAVPEDIGSFVAAGDRVTYTTVLESFQAMKNGVAAVSRRLRDRERCFRGYVSKCRTEELQLPHLDAIELETIESSSYETAREIQTILAEAQESTLAVQPVIRLSGSVCGRNTPGDPYFSTRERATLSGEIYRIPTFLGNIRFTDSAVHAQVPFYGYFARNDARYILNTPFTYYGCMRIGSDVGRLFAVQAVREFAETQPVSAFAHGASADELRILEARLTASGIAINEYDASEYVNLALALIVEDRLPKEISDAVVSLANAFRMGSAGFENTVLAIADISERNVKLVESGIAVGIEAPYLFYVRSGYTALFMTHNPSLGVDSGFFEPVSIAPEDQPFTFYSDLQGRGVSRQKLVRDLGFYYRVHEDPTGAPR